VHRAFIATCTTICIQIMHLARRVAVFLDSRARTITEVRAVVGWIAACSLFAASVHADPSDDDLHVLPCRPTVTCTAELAPPGTLELELGYQLRRVNDGAAYEHATPILLKLPVATWVEAQLGSNGYTLTPIARYFDNVNLGVKLHLLDQSERRPSIAFTVAASVPTAAQEGYARAYDLFATAHASKDLGKWHVDWNAGLYAWQLEGPVAYQGFTALAASYAITGKLSATVEPHYFSEAAPISPRDAGAIGAIAYAVRTWLVIDGAIDVVFEDQSSVAGLVGISIAPVRVWGGH
jgi:hypothetical protein